MGRIMRGLLDYVFYNLEERDLDRSQIAAYIRYLDEILLQGLSPEKELAYQTIKLQLLKRLNELNQEQIQFYRKEEEDKEI